jgi:hypothetical protein
MYRLPSATLRRWAYRLDSHDITSHAHHMPHRLDFCDLRHHVAGVLLHRHATEQAKIESLGGPMRR